MNENGTEISEELRQEILFRLHKEMEGKPAVYWAGMNIAIKIIKEIKPESVKNGRENIKKS